MSYGPCFPSRLTVLCRDVREKNRPDDQTRNSETVADLLDQQPSGSEGRRGDVLADKVVNCAGDDLHVSFKHSTERIQAHQVHGHDERLGSDDAECKVFRFPHLCDECEEVGGASVSKDHHRDGLHRLEESRLSEGVGDDGELALGRQARAIGDAHGGREGDDGGQDGDETDPTEP